MAKYRVPQVRLSTAYLALILAKIFQTDVVHDVSCADQQRVPVLPEQFEVVRVGLVAKEGPYLVCKNKQTLEICEILFTGLRHDAQSLVGRRRARSESKVDELGSLEFVK